MNWRQHLLIGALCGAAVAYYFQFAPLSLALFTLVSALSALLPDFDLRKSKISQVGYAAMLAISLFLAWQWSGPGGYSEVAVNFITILFVFLALDLLLRPRHRGVMHSLGFLALLTVAAYLLFGQFIAAALAVGFLSHLIADNSVKLR